MNIQPTPYDLNFRMFGIPVRVHPLFWLTIAMFSWPWAAKGMQFWLIVMACMFVSLLAHELAHALAFRFYGVRSFIICYFFVGLTQPERQLRKSNHRIAVTLAGPFANFLIAAIIWGSNRMEPWAITNDYTGVLYLILFEINLLWGLLNMLPVYPLDGGQVSRELWIRASNTFTGIINSLRMSLFVAGAFAVFAFSCEFNLIPPGIIPYWLSPGLFAGVLFALLAVQNYVELQNMQRAHGYSDRSNWR